MSYWDHYTLIVSLYAMASVSGMGIVVPGTLYQQAEHGEISWRTAHIGATLTLFLPVGLAFISLIDNMTFQAIKTFLFWLEA